MGSLFHRGPDEEGLFVNDKINLGFRRLSIVDIKSGQQPVHNEDKSLWSIFNGEIYNHKELRGELLKKGHQFYTDHSDSELIVHLYEEYGESFVKKINGMFAIAVWNNNEERLLLFRDRMGVKPLYYYYMKILKKVRLNLCLIFCCFFLLRARIFFYNFLFLCRIFIARLNNKTNNSI